MDSANERRLNDVTPFSLAESIPIMIPVTWRLRPIAWTYRNLSILYGCDGASNHQTQQCLLNPLFRCRTKKTSNLRVTSLCEGNSPVTGQFPAQMASNAENASIWLRHHGIVNTPEVSASTPINRCECQHPLPSRHTYIFEVSVTPRSPRKIFFNSDIPDKFQIRLKQNFITWCADISPCHYTPSLS